MADVDPSPFTPPSESLLFLDEDMIPTIDMGALPTDRVDNLYTETACPYWDPRIKGHLISRPDPKTKQPVSRPGRFRFSTKEQEARQTIRTQAKNRRRKLATYPCRDPDLLNWDTWKQQAKVLEQPSISSHHSANIPPQPPSPQPPSPQSSPPHQPPPPSSSPPDSADGS